MKRGVDNTKNRPLSRTDPFHDPFQSGIDFAICFALLILLSLTVVGAPIGWLFAAAYGAHRAKESNRKLQLAILPVGQVPPIIEVPPIIPHK